MIIASIWLLKLVLAHLGTDFILQPASWVDDRSRRHFASGKLYLHGLITALLAWLLAGWEYWPAALIIGVTHTLIDGWKSYRRKTVGYFLADQCLHVAVIAGCWYYYFITPADVLRAWVHLDTQVTFWKIATAFIFLTAPAGILIGQLTRQWREKIKIDNAENLESLANAGKWIGIVERIIILIFVLYNQFSAIGLLVAAKGIIRFNEKDRQEIKTEYLVIGTLMSISLAVVAGLLTKI